MDCRGALDSCILPSRLLTLLSIKTDSRFDSSADLVVLLLERLRAPPSLNLPLANPGNTKLGAAPCALVAALPAGDMKGVRASRIFWRFS